MNWNKYSDNLHNLPVNVNPSENSESETDNAFECSAKNIITAILFSFYAPKKRKNANSLREEIIQEIKLKNRLRREWQSTRDSNTKKFLNNKINFIRAIITTHKQDEWNKFLDSLNHKDGLIYKTN